MEIKLLTRTFTLDEAKRKYPTISPDIVESIFRYVVHHTPTGSFLRAVLENNLKESFARADDHNQGTMFEIVKLVYNDIPMGCWGSPAEVWEWLNPDEERSDENTQNKG